MPLDSVIDGLSDENVDVVDVFDAEEDLEFEEKESCWTKFCDTICDCIRQPTEEQLLHRRFVRKHQPKLFHGARFELITAPKERSFTALTMFSSPHDNPAKTDIWLKMNTNHELVWNSLEKDNSNNPVKSGSV